LLPTAGPTRNVLNVAEALSEWADVTVAFRSIVEPLNTTKYRVLALEPSAVHFTNAMDDNAVRGVHPFQHLAYCRTLFAFAKHQARSFDVVLEKGWRLSGVLSAAFHREGVPAILVENAVSLWTEPLNDVRVIGKYILHRLAHVLACSCCRRLPMVVAETDELKTMLVAHRGISPDRINVIGLGVDHRLFRPMDQRVARDSLGINQDVLVLLYVGGMDEYHDLESVIEALGRVASRSLELHVVGDGEFRARCEAKARQAVIQSRFRGHIPHMMVPHYIAASDLCLAPYRTAAFHNGLVTFSTLKIPEYMACGRPVASIPSAAIQRLVEDRVTGFLFPNDVSSWTTFLQQLPSREQLASMGCAATQAVRTIAWENTAARYLQACQSLVSERSC
jgi:glycosyltransferase involved in cell wall biosynthesis